MISPVDRLCAKCNKNIRGEQNKEKTNSINRLTQGKPTPTNKFKN